MDSPMLQMLKIKNLTATINDEIILQNVNLEIKSNSLHVIIGPKCSGKSGLVHAISGKPELSIKDGIIKFKNKSILDKTQEERSFLGIFSSFQHLPSLDGVTNFTLVKVFLSTLSYLGLYLFMLSFFKSFLFSYRNRIFVKI
jgi:Fe-S cluster assembly ATPase SufC